MDLRRTSLLDLTISVTALAALCGPAPALAESMSSALARAYDSNPDINQQRAAVRAKDEGVPAAKAGWLPNANATYSAGHQVTNVSNVLGGQAARKSWSPIRAVPP